MRGLRDLVPDAGAVAVAGALVAAAVVIGGAIEREHGTLRVHWPPYYAKLEPHLGPGTPAALLVAAAVIGYGPALAARLPWRRLLAAAWGASMAWIWSLALVDGWHRGVENQLTSAYEYLQEVDRFGDVGAALRTFTDHILLHSPDNWVHMWPAIRPPPCSPSSGWTAWGWAAARGRPPGSSPSGRRPLPPYWWRCVP